MDEEEARPRFLLAGPARVDAVAAVMEVLRPAGLLLEPDQPSAGLVGFPVDLRKVAEDAGVAFLVRDDADLAAEARADGVHLSDPAKVETMRGRLLDDQILGVSAGLSRHDAMTSGEQGADYIAFGDDDAALTGEIVDLVTWWQEITMLPCLAFASNAEDVVRLAYIGTDFIGVASAIWDHPDGPLAGAELMQKAIEAR